MGSKTHASPTFAWTVFLAITDSVIRFTVHCVLKDSSVLGYHFQHGGFAGLQKTIPHKYTQTFIATLFVIYLKVETTQMSIN